MRRRAPPRWRALQGLGPCVRERSGRTGAERYIYQALSAVHALQACLAPARARSVQGGGQSRPRGQVAGLVGCAVVMLHAASCDSKTWGEGVK